MSRQKVVEIANAQVGIRGKPNKFTKWYGSIGGTTSYAWCVVFIGWCFNEAGLNTFPRTASVIQTLDHAKNKGCFKAKGSYTPQAGDVMIQQSGGASHVGIVTGAGNNCFYTIEGNYSDSVAKVTRYYDNKLTGFFTPPYSQNSEPQPTQASSYADTTSNLPKDPVLIDNFGSGNVSIRDDFNITKDETFKLFADGIDITKNTGNLSWQNTIAELATTMSFDVAKTDAKHLNLYQPTVGSIINLYTNIEIFRGIVLKVDDGNKYSNKYTVTDFGWYLNKSKETYQFNDMPVHKVFEKICNDFNIPIEYICYIDKKITQIYIDKTISEIIDDVLENAGGNMGTGTACFNYDLVPTGLRVYRIGEFYAYPEFQLSSNTQKIYSPDLMGDVSHSLSIEDLKNSIKVISETDNVTTVKAVAKDNDSIYKFGLLQDVVKVDLEKQNPNTVAEQTLRETSRIKEEFSITIIEAVDSYTRAGHLIAIENIFYLIEGASHSIKNGWHFVKLDLRRW